MFGAKFRKKYLQKKFWKIFKHKILENFGKKKCWKKLLTKKMLEK